MPGDGYIVVWSKFSRGVNCVPNLVWWACLAKRAMTVDASVSRRVSKEGRARRRQVLVPHSARGRHWRFLVRARGRGEAEREGGEKRTCWVVLGRLMIQTEIDGRAMDTKDGTVDNSGSKTGWRVQRHGGTRYGTVCTLGPQVKKAKAQLQVLLCCPPPEAAGIRTAAGVLRGALDGR
ncbi:hypothetical protein LX32DRAFT_41413 [Colletotrichum zoysiae]|uniref:Uncharacterized protein n=1 Tax=Colletotrichum zoysiae TaxID=1216348 RepID=A0AAD9HR74_9PEZI|nr:hypothetical protein LX32DRAFT_41413 [Colletotrichum zoysiae]